METAWICAASRTPFARAGKGALAGARPDDLLAGLFRRLLAGLPDGAREMVDEVVVGCAYPEAEQGRNAARAIALAAGLPDHVPAMTLTRMCASSLEATAIACAKVRLGEASLVLVGGVESMSRIPIGGVKPSPNPDLLERRPRLPPRHGIRSLPNPASPTGGLGRPSSTTRWARPARAPPSSRARVSIRRRW